jgi:hypothetical protein
MVFRPHPIMLFLSLGFPFFIFCLAVFSNKRISGVHTFNFGLALNVVADAVRVAVSLGGSHKKYPRNKDKRYQNVS